MRTVGGPPRDLMVWWQRRAGQCRIVSLTQFEPKITSSQAQLKRRRRRMRHGARRAVQREMSKAGLLRVIGPSDSWMILVEWETQNGRRKTPGTCLRTLSGACVVLVPRLARAVPRYASELQSWAQNLGKRGLADRTVRTGDARWLTSPRDGAPSASRLPPQASLA